MLHLGKAGPGQFCSVELAASDADAAKANRVGAQVGLWEPIGLNRGETTYA